VTTGRHRGPRRAPIATVWTSTLVLVTVATLSSTVVTLSRPATVSGRASSDGVAGTVTQPDGNRLATAAERPAAVPVRLRIDKLGLTTELVRLNLDQSGTLQAPDSPQVAGWLAEGPVPGDAGPAVLAGHVDSTRGPGVFFLLKSMQLGDRVLVERSDGRTVVFAVTSVEMFPKGQFPADEVYGPTPVPELRLVTCGGPFNRVGGRDLDNVIVQAVAAP
jgi:sortase (surface protein transpeptidase)